MDVSFSRATTTSFTYDAQAKKYVNTNSHAPATDHFAPALDAARRETIRARWRDAIRQAVGKRQGEAGAEAGSA